MNSAVFLTRTAEKDAMSLSGEYRERVKNALRILAEAPLKGEALVGTYSGLRRYRVGDFRIVYEFDSSRHRILMIKIRHRKEAYK